MEVNSVFFSVARIMQTPVATVMATLPYNCDDIRQSFA